jgi:hypothetical protein
VGLAIWLRVARNWISDEVAGLAPAWPLLVLAPLGSCGCEACCDGSFHRSTGAKTRIQTSDFDMAGGCIATGTERDMEVVRTVGPRRMSGCGPARPKALKRAGGMPPPSPTRPPRGLGSLLRSPLRSRPRRQKRGCQRPRPRPQPQATPWRWYSRRARGVRSAEWGPQLGLAVGGWWPRPPQPQGAGGGWRARTQGGSCGLASVPGRGLLRWAGTCVP